MTRYQFTPELLDAIPEELAELFRGIELTLLEEIASRLKAAGQLNEVTVSDIRALRAHGISLDEIEKAIRETTGISEKKLAELLDDVVERNQVYYNDLITLADVTRPETLVDALTIDAIRRQTEDTFRNITRSMGFLVDAGRTMLPPAEAYQWALNSAELQIQSGAISYNQAIANATRQLADSGLQYVDYESGWRNHVDVAVRRAVMSGVSQINQQYAIQSMEYLGTEYVEVSAHAGARDIDGPKGWEAHTRWQGKVYHWKRLEHDGVAPDQEETTRQEIISVETKQNPAIMGVERNSGGLHVTTIGRIDKEIYKVVTPDIQTDEVIITDERIAHIKERHPNDYERYFSYFKDIVSSPDYILEANKPNTAFILKEIDNVGEHFQMILRLAVSGDPDGYKNSVITFLNTDEKRYARYLRTKKILYKSE